MATVYGSSESSMGSEKHASIGGHASRWHTML
jgi:hypothetical protein